MSVDLRKILLFDEFLQSCKAIKREKWRYLYLLYHFVWFGGLLKFKFDDSFLLFNFAISAILAIHNGLDLRKIIIVLMVYGLMVFVPIGMYGIDGIMLNQYIGYGIRILTACFVASYFRRDFITKFENLVFVLTYISLPLFIIQIINPHIYDIVLPLTDLLINFDNYSYNHRYLIVFVLNGWALKRNSGFMWEPGAFAMMLSWAMLFIIYLNKFRFHRRMFVYILVMLTTFSLLGYATMMVLVVLSLAQNADWKKIGYLVIGGGLMLLLFSQVSLFQEQREMMANKTERYANDSQAQLYRARKKYIVEETGHRQVGRLAQFYMLSDIIKEDPFGHGMSKWRYGSANGLIDLIVKWGINAILIIIISFYFFSKRLAQMAQLRPKWYVILMTMAILVMPAISNPVYNRVFFLSLIVFPLFAKRQQIPNIYAR